MSIKRKDFVFTVGAATAAAASDPAAVEAATARKPPADRAKRSVEPLGQTPEAYVYFTAPESAFVEAAVERIVPTDGHGMGGKDAGVAFFIDRQLNGQYGYAAKMYRHGPWAQGTPSQGYQLPLTPREVYRLGIAAVNAHCNATFSKTFDRLDAAHQDDVLRACESGAVASEAVPIATFFAMLLQNTTEGFFADPTYGGNRGKTGWKQIGFPGVAAAYIGLIERYNVPYRPAPVGLADVEQSVGMSDPDAHLSRVMQMHGDKG